MTTSSNVAVRGGMLCCPTQKAPREGSLLVRDGRIECILPADAPLPAGYEAFDASGCWVLPGAVDLYTELRDPGREDEETLEETLRAALRGGYTSLLALPTTTPVVDGGEGVRERLLRCARLGGPDVWVAGALTQGAKGEELAEIGEMYATGARVFTDAPRAVQDAELLRRAMEYTRGFGGLVMTVGACPALSGRGVVAEGAVSTRLGLRGIPEAAEVTFVARHIELARLTGARTHLGLISSARSLRLIERAQDEGLELSASVTPFHLRFDEQEHLTRPYDTSLRLSPPLRTDEDRQALLEGVRNGRLVVASGHSPQGPVHREVEFSDAPPGATSLQSVLALLTSDDVLGTEDPIAIARATALGPTRILDLSDRGHLVEGARADVVVFDPSAAPRAERNFFAADVVSSPVWEQTLGGQVKYTFCGGECRFQLSGNEGNPK